LLAHAAQCGACAERLRLLTADATAEETAELGKWLRRRLNGNTTWRRTGAYAAPFSRFKKDALLSLGRSRAGCFTFAGGWGRLWWQRANTPERLLAEAYTHDRIFELRMPDAGFADVTPQTHLRGGAAAHESARLLDAHARIERQLENARKIRTGCNWKPAPTFWKRSTIRPSTFSTA